MDTPIFDFVTRYAESGTLRLHMPGHKGAGDLERLDITEVEGADSLYEADGIIAQSERNASELFGCPTFYSTEGSSQCIRAMLFLAVCGGTNRRILAGRNAHKTFTSAAALLDLEVEWLCGGDSYLSCTPDAAELDRILDAMDPKPAAVYLTSPDYLGHTADIRSAAEVCHRHKALLLVDNAHGAYLKFLAGSRHPIDLGADLCCDSAHKTLPVLTGGAYLHIRPGLDELCGRAKPALELFGSTSPSYLILQSLDRANRYLSDGYRERLCAFVQDASRLCERLSAHGFTLAGDEPLKLTLCTKPYGYEGGELAAILRQGGIEPEFADPDFVVMMLTPELGGEALLRIEELVCSVPKKAPITAAPPQFILPERAMSVREAVFAPSEELPLSLCAGRILASAGVGCPPAVPIAVCGERLDPRVLERFAYYGISSCRVVKAE